MPYLILPSRRLRQPAGAVRVNAALAAQLGVVALFDIRSGVELMSGAVRAYSTAPLRLEAGGALGDFSVSTFQSWDSRPEYAIVGDLSIISYLTVDSLTGYGAIVSKQYSPTSYAPYEFRIGFGSGDSWLCILRANSGGYTQRYGSTNAVDVGVPSVVAVSARNYTTADPAKAYTTKGRGAPQSLSTPAASIGTAPEDHASRPAVRIGRRVDGATQFDGAIYYVTLCNRLLSDEAGLDAVRYPWMLYAHGRHPLWFDVGAGGGAGTITGESAAILSDVVGSAVGAVALAGGSAIGLGAVAGSAAGAVVVGGQSSGALAQVSGPSAGTVQTSGTSASALEPVLGVAGGAIGVSGGSAQGLGPVTGTATGVVGSTPIIGESTATLGSVGGGASGAVEIGGVTAGAVGTVGGSAAASVPVAGNSAQSLAPVTGSATGAIGSSPIAGASAQVLVGVFGFAAGQCLVRGASAGVVGTVTAPGNGSPTLTTDPRYIVRAARGRFLVVSSGRQFRVAA